MRRYCSQLIRVGTGGFSSRKIPTDMAIRSIFVTFDIDYQKCVLHLKNVDDDVAVTYRGMLAPYCNETWVSPSGCHFSTEASDGHIYGFQIDKGVLLAGLAEECEQAGCTVQCDYRCLRHCGKLKGSHAYAEGSCTDRQAITSERVILADGAFSSLVQTAWV